MTGQKVAQNLHARTELRSTKWFGFLTAVLLVFASVPVFAGDGDVEAAHAVDNQRILGVIPNYQTVSDPTLTYSPISTKEKFNLFLKSTVDPFVISNIVLGASISQMRGGTPDYGTGGGAFAARFGAAMGDMTSQNLISGAVLPTLLHEDPRYFRMGPGHGVVPRIAYALSRVAVTRKDNGTEGVNWSFLVGTAAAVGLSNAWYPDASRGMGVSGSRIAAITIGSATGNLLPEFWPDIHDRVLPHLLPYLLPHIKRAAQSTAPAVN